MKNDHKLWVVGMYYHWFTFGRHRDHITLDSGLLYRFFSALLWPWLPVWESVSEWVSDLRVRYSKYWSMEAFVTGVMSSINKSNQIKWNALTVAVILTLLAVKSLNYLATNLLALTLYYHTHYRYCQLPYISFPSVAFSTNDLWAHPVRRSCHWFYTRSWQTDGLQSTTCPEVA